ncbi:hypothetical protein IM543_11240 [Massilia sp. UMI-21]|nr:hypothetical protein IM543_11240 [Massilia sp. UMI-21]
MTAPTRSTVTILAAAASTGGTKAAPATTGAWVDVRTFNGGDIAWSVKNGSSAPGVQGQFTLQVSDANDGTNISDLWSGGGDVTANSETTGLIDLPSAASYVRMICYGNTTNPVTFKAVLFAKG